MLKRGEEVFVANIQYTRPLSSFAPYLQLDMCMTLKSLGFLTLASHSAVLSSILVTRERMFTDVRNSREADKGSILRYTRLLGS